MNWRYKQNKVNEIVCIINGINSIDFSQTIQHEVKWLIEPGYWSNRRFGDLNSFHSLFPQKVENWESPEGRLICGSDLCRDQCQIGLPHGDTQFPFKLGSPNFGPDVQNTLVNILVFGGMGWGVLGIDRDFQGEI